MATGNTSAKLSLLQGTKYSTLLRHTSKEVAQAYLEANLEGQEWLLRFCATHGVPTQVRDAVTYAADPGERSTAHEEYDAARSLGLDVTWHDTLDVPFPNHGATVLPGQAQFDPMDVLAGLVEQFRSHGGTLHQGVRLTNVSWAGHATATLSHGEAPPPGHGEGSSSRLRAREVVLATGAPVLNRGLYFAKVEPKRSYLLSYEFASELEGMYLSVGRSSRSVRDVPAAPGGPGHLLVGGSGHVVGRTSSELAHVEELRDWTQRYFPGAIETHNWSAQDYTSHDGIPYVGLLPRGAGRIHVATGFDKWGMTNGVAAARTISGSILGEKPTWARTLNRRLSRPRSASRILTVNARGIAANLASMFRAGTARVEDGTCPIVALCTHAGGTLKWNDAEKSWDCPWHGSRFAPDGSVLEGPATRALARRGTSD